MDEENLSSYLTACYENLMDDATRIEWKKEHKDRTKTPDIETLMKFLNERAQAIASENTTTKRSQKQDYSNNKRSKSVTYVAHSSFPFSCAVCKGRHPLYVCTRFKAMPRDQMASIVRDNNLCFNCLHPGHSTRQCASSHRCQKCQKPCCILTSQDLLPPASQVLIHLRLEPS